MDGFQIFLIAFSSFVGVVIIAVNIYLLTLYLHPDDKGLTRYIYAKIFIIIGLTICQSQALLVPLDVALTSPDSQIFSIGLFWAILYAVILAFICIFIPLSIFFYETDEQKGMAHRILRTVGYWLITMIISSMIFFISWRFWRYYDLPVYELSLKQQNQGINPIFQVQQKSYVITGQQTTIPIYTIAIISWFGWFFVVFFGGVGLFALPMDLINQFRLRPKVRKSQQMKLTKKKLIDSINSLISYGQKINQSDIQYERVEDEAGCWQKFRTKRKVNTKFTKFKVKYHLLNQQFSLFNLQLKVADTNPVIPIFKLILGIIFTITSLLWMIQIIFGNIAKNGTLKVPLLPFLNELLIHLNTHNAGLFSTVIYAYLSVYMMWCVQKGSIKMGMRFPFCCRFYPMKQNQTAINGFLVNVLFLVMASVSVTQLCISSFTFYTQRTQIHLIFQVVIKTMPFFGIFYQKCVFTIALVCWTLLSLLYLLVTCNKTPSYMRQIQEIHKRKQQQIQKLQ